MIVIKKRCYVMLTVFHHSQNRMFSSAFVVLFSKHRMVSYFSSGYEIESLHSASKAMHVALQNISLRLTSLSH